ncbi:hypothetical protein FHR22_002629 [Sphingopyxis panaciterrae]|uniref:hypothetical protein n=1 Tax=Sphingopyxis panaciterrae TaxID=363841 RepID=UPI00141E79EC|nr:hypothetical protein [Sphingopyxis panaciterrae]NIJ37926.1 hypothetical protein [Sphingopyxis panaciterrae]
MAAQNNYPARVRAGGAAYIPLTAFNNRDYPLLIVFRGVDLTTATFRGQVRSRPDADGAPQAEFSFTSELVDGSTVVTGSIAKADIVALPVAAEPGAASLSYYDISIEMVGGIEETKFAGEFYRAGSITK